MLCPGLSYLIRWVNMSQVIKSKGQFLGLNGLWTKLFFIFFSDMPTCQIIAATKYLAMSCYKKSVVAMRGDV